MSGDYRVVVDAWTLYVSRVSSQLGLRLLTVYGVRGNPVPCCLGDCVATNCYRFLRDTW